MEQKKSIPVPLSAISERKSGTAHLPIFPTADNFPCIGVLTIAEAKPGKGSTAGWGRLKSWVGWISLDYCKKI